LFRIGFGYDAHRLVKGRPLILGGINIPHAFGLEGHSDADVLTHAIMDAILGALALGDIGKHFPDKDPLYKGASSISLLENVMEMAEREGFGVNNIDSTICAQEPMLSTYIDGMKTNISGALKSDKSLVSIKATTTEKMGFCGRLEGIEAYAVASLVAAPRNNRDL